MLLISNAVDHMCSLDLFPESVHINSGFLALGNVISALGDPKKKSSLIPVYSALYISLIISRISTY